MKRLFHGWSWEHWYNLAREDIEAAFDSVRRVGRIALYVGLGLWLMSGFHAVRQNEVGLTFVCGKVSRGYEEPGLRYRLPWPVGKVIRVPLQTQQRVMVGLPEEGMTAANRLGTYVEGALDTTVAREVEGRPEGDDEDSVLDEMIREGQERQTGEAARVRLGRGIPLLTADHNVILVQAVVQYLIKNPRQFIFTTEVPELVLRRATTNALLSEAARTDVDSLLTTARLQVQSRVRAQVAEQIAPYEMGVEVVGVELQKVDAPEAVKAAFRGVNTAREEKNTRVNEAQQYAGTVVPEAEGQAATIAREADAYKAQRLAEARGEESRFRGVMDQYQQSGGLTGERLRLETIERVLQRATKVQVGGTPSEPVDIRIAVPQPGTEN